MKKLIIILFLVSTNLFSQQPCNIPFTPCWCETHQEACNHANQTIPLNEDIWILILLGVSYGGYEIYKSYKIKKEIVWDK